MDNIDVGVQIILHRVGDYLLQNSFIALNKKQDWRVAGLHAFIYSIPFAIAQIAFTDRGMWAIGISLAIIAGTHWAIDYFNGSSWWTKLYNWDFSEPPKTPFWVMVEVDQTLHVCLNCLALYWTR